MINKLWYLYALVCCVYAQISIDESPEPASEDPIAAFVNELQQKVYDKKSDIVSSIKSFRQQHIDLLRELSNEIEASRNSYIVELEELAENVDQFVLVNENNGKDISNCTSTFYVKTYDANLKLDDLNINLVDTNSTLKKISKKIGALSKQIGSYKKVMKSCKFQPLVDDVTGLSATTAGTCATDYLSGVDLQVDDVKNSINDDISEAKASMRGVIMAIENEIRSMISDATEQFLSCVK